MLYGQLAFDQRRAVGGKTQARDYHEKTNPGRIHGAAHIEAAEISVANAARSALQRMRRAGSAGITVCQTPGQGARAAAQETRAEAPLLQHAEL